jgi:hypothetical protein
MKLLLRACVRACVAVQLALTGSALDGVTPPTESLGPSAMGDIAPSRPRPPSATPLLSSWPLPLLCAPLAVR